MHSINPEQARILNELRYRSFLSYNELWNKQGKSSRFAYHLRALEKKGFVKKHPAGYCLTLEGIKFSDYLSFDSPQPIIVIMVVPKKGNHVLVTAREKYPYKGYKEFCASKLQQHETLLDAAHDRLHKRFGLTGNITYKGMEFLQTKERDQMIMHHHLHIFLATDLKGTPTQGTWIPINEFPPENAMPHLDQTLRIALGNGFSFATSDLIKKGDEMTGYVTHSFKHFKK